MIFGGHMFPSDAGQLRLYAGDDFSRTYRFSEAGVPIDLTAWSGWAAEWRYQDKVEAFTVDDSRLAEGMVTVALTAAQTRTMSGIGTWDLQASYGDLTRTWVRGTTAHTIDVTGRP